MARHAAFQTHGKMLVNERRGLIAVTIETARLAAAKGPLLRRRHDAAVGIVTIHARHGAFWQPMLELTLKARPDIGMATGTLLINGGRPPFD
jgi:hypothetical protein